jgi:hypothetical protein
LAYDPETGIFKHKRKAAGIKFGSIAGSPSGGDDPEHPYWRIRVDGYGYYAHHLAWFYVYEVWPEQLDHKDTNKQNNAINNLRESTTRQNAGNQGSRKNNTLGVKGVRKAKRSYSLAKPYNARINIGTKSIHLGYFETIEEAHQAYLNAAKIHYGEFARG